jgi:hypothetical protein
VCTHACDSGQWRFLVVGDVIVGDEVTTDELLVNLHTINGFSTRIRVASKLSHDMEVWSMMAKRCSISPINHTKRDIV